MPPVPTSPTPATGPGRPRLVGRLRSGGSPREEILDAAGELFTTHGYAGTSTRKIAEAVGMRQASLYHHFATKEDILVALLRDTVVPSLEVARTATTDVPPAERLLSLVRFDAAQLAGARWNLGALYLLPELRSERFSAFRDARIELATVYADLTAEVVGSADDPRTTLPFRLVESVISMRSDGDLGDPDAPGAEADRARVVEGLVLAITEMLR
ncbi:TetR/AcrR family transcriptional regulator [Williamsia sterculiae]|uniref:TetR/AcrR family transcriptional regulator n=1 Tax=Williamsia sterculiae TaxID=1344003 RepID=UPI000970A930